MLAPATLLLDSGSARRAVEVGVYRRAGGQEVEQVAIEVAHLDAGGFGGDPDPQVGIGDLPRVGEQARPQREPGVLLRQVEGGDRVGVGQRAVERVLIRHGGPQPQRPLLRGKGDEVEGGERGQRGKGQPEKGDRRLVIGRQGLDGLPAPIPGEQRGVGVILHPEQVIGCKLATVLGGEADSGAAAEGVVSRRRAAPVKDAATPTVTDALTATNGQAIEGERARRRHVENAEREPGWIWRTIRVWPARPDANENLHTCLPLCFSAPRADQSSRVQSHRRSEVREKGAATTRKPQYPLRRSGTP
jgi:hypothetical protein